MRNVRKGTEKRSICSALALSVNKFSTQVESMEQADLETVLACVMMACVVPLSVSRTFRTDGRQLALLPALRTVRELAQVTCLKSERKQHRNVSCQHWAQRAPSIRGGAAAVLCMLRNSCPRDGTTSVPVGRGWRPAFSSFWTMADRRCAQR